MLQCTISYVRLNTLRALEPNSGIFWVKVSIQAVVEWDSTQLRENSIFILDHIAQALFLHSEEHVLSLLTSMNASP